MDPHHKRQEVPYKCDECDNNNNVRVYGVEEIPGDFDPEVDGPAYLCLYCAP